MAESMIETTPYQESKPLDPYRTLQLHPTAPRDLVDEVYWLLASNLRSGAPDAESRALLSDLNEAYALLSDEQRRSDYDDEFERDARRPRRAQPRRRRRLFLVSGGAARARVTHYERLCVAPHAEARVVDLAYRVMKQASQYRRPGPEREQLDEAYRVLISREGRALYDLTAPHSTNSAEPNQDGHTDAPANAPTTVAPVAPALALPDAANDTAAPAEDVVMRGPAQQAAMHAPPEGEADEADADVAPALNAASVDERASVDDGAVATRTHNGAFSKLIRRLRTRAAAAEEGHANDPDLTAAEGPTVAQVGALNRLIGRLRRHPEDDATAERGAHDELTPARASAVHSGAGSRALMAEQEQLEASRITGLRDERVAPRAVPVRTMHEAVTGSPASIEFLGGPHAGSALGIHGGWVLRGIDPLSPEICRIAFYADRFVLHGTADAPVVNGRRLSLPLVLLDDGDEVEAGEHRFRFHIGGAAQTDRDRAASVEWSVRPHPASDNPTHASEGVTK